MTQTSYALVTGASRGLGKYFARALAARQQNLVLVARDNDRLAKLAAELEKTHGIRAETLALDLASPGAGGRVAEQLTNRGLKIDLLVNNAGFGDSGEFLRLSLARQLEMISLQNATVVELTYQLLPAMIEQRRGGIINVSSMAGFQPVPYATIYSATKSFLTTFSLALEAEMRRYKVAVVTVCPGRLRADPEEPEEGERKKVPGGEQSHEEVVRLALRGFDRGGGLVIPGAMNKLAAFAAKLIPRSRVARLIGKMTKKQHVQAGNNG
jgi:short-subunit dehydrogenase